MTLRSFRTERILDADHSRQSSRDREIQVGVLCRECLKLLFLALRDHALLILKYEVVASDQNLILSDMGGNSMGHDIVDFGMHLLMDESFFFGCRNNRRSPWSVGNALPGRQRSGASHPDRVPQR